MSGKPCLAWFLLFATLPAVAQLTTATLYGRIVDPIGAGVPQAKITLQNEETNSRANAVSDASGVFTIAYIAVGRYTVSLEARGFKGQKQSGIPLSAGQRVGTEYKLELGNVAEVVEVSLSTPQVNTVSAEQREGMTEVQGMSISAWPRTVTSLSGCICKFEATS